MQTSYFAKPGIKENPAAVSIALYPPRWWGPGRRYKDLAPTREMLKNGYVYEDYLYLLESRGLTPEKIWRDLKDKIICCWEKDKWQCHRSFVAFYLRSELSIPYFIEEL
jgi:hypothetical protein